VQSSWSLPGHSFKWRGLLLLTWNPVYSFEDSRENDYDMYGDSRENMLEVLAVVMGVRRQVALAPKLPRASLEFPWRIFALYCVFKCSTGHSHPRFQLLAFFCILPHFTSKNTFFCKIGGSTHTQLYSEHKTHTHTHTHTHNLYFLIFLSLSLSHSHTHTWTWVVYLCVPLQDSSTFLQERARCALKSETTHSHEESETSHSHLYNTGLHVCKRTQPYLHIPYRPTLRTHIGPYPAHAPLRKQVLYL